MRKWLTRVPERIGAAFELVHEYSKANREKISEGYGAAEVCSIYAGVRQRWLLVYSEQAFIREQKTLEKQLEKELELKDKELKQLASRDFDCECDAKEAWALIEKKLKYHQIEQTTIAQKRVKIGRGRPKKSDLPSIKYKIQAKLIRDASKFAKVLEGKGKFIIATNELDEKALTQQDLLKNYKSQQSVERGFRFLKDPLFMTSSVFLKNEERIVALAMIMCLCLLVYTIAQRYLRQKLKEFSESIPSQSGKPTSNPTMRWVFQIFEGVHLLIHRTVAGVRELILNLTPTRRHILQVLGPPFQKLYENAA